MRFSLVMRVIAWALLGIGAGLLAAIPAAASCVGPSGPDGTSTLRSQLDAAPTVFVGTVISTSNNGRMARVRVESVWKGGPIPTTITVSGTPDPGAAATSVDRTYREGQRYLFVPTSATSPFQDNQCTATQPYAAALDALKPAGAQSPAPGSDGLEGSVPSGTPWPWIGAILALAVAGGLGVTFAARRRR